MQAFVARPKNRTGRQLRGYQQMRIDIADTGPEEPMPVDEKQHFLGRSELGLWQVVKVAEDETARLKMTERKFTNHERMRQYLPSFEQLRESMIASSKVIYPDRSIGQDHFRGIRRRGGAFNRGWLPPRLAKRRAASRSIKALSASRTIADFSVSPVNS
jgi:hypothetical protein